MQLWVAFGTGKQFRHIHVNFICQELGADKSRALPLFHALSDSDVTSEFCDKGKKSAWKAWKAYPDATEAFIITPGIVFVPLDVSSPTFKIIERFTCIMYDSTTSQDSVHKQSKDDGQSSANTECTTATCKPIPVPRQYLEAKSEAHRGCTNSRRVWVDYIGQRMVSNVDNATSCCR